MKHLTVDEIISFVSINNMDADSMKLMSRVNSHIRSCDECLARVRALCDAYDELQRMSDKADKADISSLKNSMLKSLTEDGKNIDVDSFYGDK